MQHHGQRPDYIEATEQDSVAEFALLDTGRAFIVDVSPGDSSTSAAFQSELGT